MNGLTNTALQDKHVLRKIDAWIMPWFCLMYLLCFLDRTNIGQWANTILQRESNTEQAMLG